MSGHGPSAPHTTFCRIVILAAELRAHTHMLPDRWRQRRGRAMYTCRPCAHVKIDMHGPGGRAPMHARCCAACHVYVNSAYASACKHVKIGSRRARTHVCSVLCGLPHANARMAKHARMHMHACALFGIGCVNVGLHFNLCFCCCF